VIRYISAILFILAPLLSSGHDQIAAERHLLKDLHSLSNTSFSTYFFSAPNPAEMPALPTEANKRTGEEDDRDNDHKNLSGSQKSANNCSTTAGILHLKNTGSSLRKGGSLPLYALYHAWRHFTA
jgi:hypothetical protein